MLSLNSYKLSLLVFVIIPSVMANVDYDHLTVALRKKQTTFYEMADDKTANAVKYENLKKFSISKSTQRGLRVPLKAKILFDEQSVELSKAQLFSDGGEFNFSREYEQSPNGRGFLLKTHRFGSYGEELLGHLIKANYPTLKDFETMLDFKNADNTDYLCESDFVRGFQCYYRFKVIATLMNSDHQTSEKLPDEFELNIEATDYYLQDGAILTGVETHFYNFQFIRTFKKLEQNTSDGRDMKFDYINEDIIFNKLEKRNFKNLEVLSSDGSDFIIDQFEYRSDNFSAELRAELAKRIKDENIISKFNSSVKEDYQNENVMCIKGNGVALTCVEEDILSLKMLTNGKN